MKKWFLSFAAMAFFSLGSVNQATAHDPEVSFPCCLVIIWHSGCDCQIEREEKHYADWGHLGECSGSCTAFDW
jgi:hypothetical protein